MSALRYFLCLLYLGACTAQTWSTIPKWTDVYLRGDQGFKNIDFNLEFLMDNYEIISLEKCMWDNHNTHNTEEYFVNVTRRMRALRPNSQARILYYWAVDGSFDCYQATNDLLARPDLWLKDDLGYTVIGSHNLPHYDFRLEEASNMWKNAALDPVISTNGGANGVFLDGTNIRNFQNCHSKTCGEDGASCCVFSQESQDNYNEARGKAVASLKDDIHAIDPDNIVIGNGLMNYDFNAGHGNPIYDFYVDKLDGFCMEHVMAFESVNPNAQEPPFIKISALENLIQLRNKLVEKEKYLLVRSYPGPVGQPISNIGGIATPHLPPHYPYPQPETNLEVQQSMKDLLDFPLAVYLCAFADSKIYFAYSLWYSIVQSVPCPDNPEECQFPLDFDQLLLMNPGPPLGQAQWNGRTCSRQFENFGISVDLEDENSATWLP